MDLSNASQQLTLANESITSYGREVQALCSWRGLKELEKGTAAAQASLDFGALDNIFFRKKVGIFFIYLFDFRVLILNIHC